ncbi:hypothetical protein JOD64_005265 [Micromonospora luteifusca]|uniref:DDE Tnp4 domain-containing protein n=1 Tax=Micromonospora luteifusca TaxID=709860 RepID=A0ABS2M0R6_9ACTN|nr:hypothetical protein [Micromonospora luteifusca]
MSVTYTAVLPVGEHTVDFLTGLFAAERVRRGTRAGTRALCCRDQAVMVLRWFLDGTRMRQLATDNQISISTGYDYLNEGIDVLAARTPSLHAALLAAKAAGHDYVNIDGTLIETDRCRTPGPTEGVDLWWSGKHDQHGGNVQVVTVPDGWPIWTSEVRPGREHDTTAARAHAEILPALTEAGADLRTLGDLGYEGLADTVTVAFKNRKPADCSSPSSSSTRHTTACARSVNAATRCSRRPSERYAISASTRGGSGRSSPPRWSSSTSTTIAQHDDRP